MQSQARYFDLLVAQCDPNPIGFPPVSESQARSRLQIVKHTEMLGSVFQGGGDSASWIRHLQCLGRYARGMVPLLDGCDDTEEGQKALSVAVIGDRSHVFIAAIDDSDSAAEDAEVVLPHLSHLMREYSTRGYLCGIPGVTQDGLRDGIYPLVAGEYLLKAISSGYPIVAAAFINAGARLTDAERLENDRVSSSMVPGDTAPPWRCIEQILNDYGLANTGAEIILEADRRQRALLMNLEIESTTVDQSAPFPRHRVRL